MRNWITGLAAAAMLALGAGGAAAAQDAPPSELEAAFQTARQASPTPLSLDREQAEWLEYGDRDAAGVAERINELTVRAARDRAAWDLRTTATDLARTCVPVALDDCNNVSGGYVTREDGPPLYWQIQRGFTDDFVAGGFVLLELEPDGVTLRPVAWDFDGFVYQPPDWAEGSGDVDGDVFVAVAGVHDGTGAHNADVIFRLTGDSDRPLVQIDNFSWRDTLNDHLPQGLEVWKGVRFFYGGLMAQASLWRGNDANCCPTGGEAFLDFEIRDDRLNLRNVDVSNSLTMAVHQIPADVFAWAQRNLNCAHWSGEEPYDDERRAQIETAVVESRCDALGTDLTALRRKYADDPPVLDILAQAETP